MKNREGQPLTVNGVHYVILTSEGDCHECLAVPSSGTIVWLAEGWDLKD